MNDGKAGVPIQKSNLWSIIFSLKLGLWVTQKMIHSGVSAWFAVAGVQICLLDTNMISSPDIWITAKQAALLKKAIFEPSYLVKIRVVGYPKLIQSRGDRLLFCPWCSDMLIRYKKAFFSKHMNDSKAGGPIEKSNFWGIIFSLKLGLWVIQKNDKFRGVRLLCCRWCSDMFIGYK